MDTKKKSLGSEQLITCKKASFPLSEAHLLANNEQYAEKTALEHGKRTVCMSDSSRLVLHYNVMYCVMGNQANYHTVNKDR